MFSSAAGADVFSFAAGTDVFSPAAGADVFSLLQVLTCSLLFRS